MNEQIIVIPALKSEGNSSIDLTTKSAPTPTLITTSSPYRQRKTTPSLSQHEVIGTAVGTT